MDNSTRRGPSGFFMALLGICALALLVVMIYGVAVSNPDIVKQLMGVSDTSDGADYGGMGYGDMMGDMTYDESMGDMAYDESTGDMTYDESTGDMTYDESTGDETGDVGGGESTNGETGDLTDAQPEADAAVPEGVIAVG